MKKTRLLICFMLAFVMLVGAVQAFATEVTEPTTEAVDETVDATVDETVEETVEDTTTTTTVDDSVCPKTEDGKHVYQDGWKTGTHKATGIVGHWRYCTKCQKAVGAEAHSFSEPDENYQMTCSVCGKKEDVPHEHGFAQQWSKNAYTHWHKCENTFGLKGTTFCKEKADEAEHTYGEDGLCTVCGANDVVPEERPGDAGIKWIVIIVIGVVGVASAAAVFLIKKK